MTTLGRRMNRSKTVQHAGPLPDPWEQEWAPQPEPVQAAGPPPGRLLTPAEQFGMFPGHRQQARPAHPAQPLMSGTACARESLGQKQSAEPAGPPPDAKQDRQLATKKAECQSLLDLHQDVKQDGRLLDTKKAECRSLLDRRRQSSLAKESPRPCRCSHLPRKLRRQVLLLLKFRQTLQEYAKKNVEVPKVIPKIPPDRLVARNLVGKGGKGKLPAFPGLSGKAKAMAQKGQGLDPHLVGKGRPGEAHPATLS